MEIKTLRQVGRIPYTSAVWVNRAETHGAAFEGLAIQSIYNFHIVISAASPRLPKWLPIDIISYLVYHPEVREACRHFDGRTTGYAYQAAADETEEIEITEEIDDKDIMNTKIPNWIIKHKLIILLVAAITPIGIDHISSLGKPLSFTN